MLVIGKGLGGGIMPFAALLASEQLNCASHTALGHYTHEKSPVSAAAALATINTIENENLLAHCEAMGKYFEQQLLALKAQFSMIHDVRGLGLFWGVELRFDDGKKAKDLAERIMYRALSLGLNFKVTMGNVLTLTPPIIIQREQLDDAILILQECLSLEIDTKKER